MKLVRQLSAVEMEFVAFTSLVMTLKCIADGMKPRQLPNDFVKVALNDAFFVHFLKP